MTTLEKAKSILAGALFVPVEKIGDDMEINDIGELNSLSFEMIIVDIEKHLGREINPMQLLDMNTVRDLAALLEGGEGG